MAGLQALFGDTAQSKADLKRLYDPRLTAAQSLSQMALSGAPAQGGWGEAIARVVAGGLAGKYQREAKNEEAAKQDNVQSALSQAMRLGQGWEPETKTYNDGITINWEGQKGDMGKMAQALMSNADTAPIGMGVQGAMLDNKMATDAALQKALFENAAKANEPITPYQQAQLDQGRQKLEQGNGGFNMVMPDGTEINLGGSGNKAMGVQLGKNLANNAVKPDNDVAKLNNTLNMANAAERLNSTADAGYPALGKQLLGRVTNDTAMTKGMKAGRNDYTQLESLAATMGAESLKPLMGSAQLSNVDVSTAKTAASFNPNMTKDERGARIAQLKGILERRRDLAAAEQEAARRGSPFGEPEIRQFYANKGLDYDTGMPLQAVAPQAPQANQAPQQGVVATPKGQFNAAAARAAGYTEAEIQQYLRVQ